MIRPETPSPSGALKIGFTGFPGDFNPSRIRRLLESKFDVLWTLDNPDYIIFSVFDYAHLEFPEAVRIFFTGENVHPDFNLCDYAFGYDWLTFEDRYYRCPNYQLYDEFKDVCRRRRSRLSRGDVAAKTKFCNFIYSNGNSHPFRDEFFHLLSEYRRVDSPGAHLNNMPSPVGAAYRGQWSAEKVRFQAHYKFSIAFENSSTVGYTTEKIVHALAAETVPIYWGNPEVAREFNSRRFINCHEFSSPAEMVERVRQVDQDDALFEQMLSEPFFPSDNVPDYLQDAQVLAQFAHIFMQDKKDALRRNRYAWGRQYEERRLAEVRAAAELEERKRLAAEIS
jgi:alpha(1,3/1,4) fucosyltransferase